jgi:hypothetical protein
MKALASEERAMDRKCAVAILALGLLAGAAATRADDPQPGIIFSGTVEKTGDVSFPGVPKSERTIVVVVDRVLTKPAAVSLSKGQRVTVEAADAAALPVGSRFKFFAQGWIYGTGVAVRELRHEAVSGESPTAEAPRMTPQLLSDSQLKGRLDAADIVVTGRVSAVRVLRRPMLAGTTRPRISEHAPNWQEATVRVETTLKGAAGSREVIVRFPGSWDVAWASHPKLKEGQTGTFILKKDEVTGAGAPITSAPSVAAHTALDPADVLPIAQQARVRELLRAQ